MIGRWPRDSTASMSPRALRWKAATDARSLTVRTSIWWWGTRARSAGLGLAVPMSMPR